MVRAAVAQVLLFIAAITVSSMVAGVVVTEAGRYAQSVDDESDRNVAAIDAEIAIINDADAANAGAYDAENDTVTIYVKNIGGNTLESDPEAIDVLVNGEYVPADALETRGLGADNGGDNDSENANTHWRVDTVLEATVDLEADASLELEDGENRVVVTVASARDSLPFEVE